MGARARRRRRSGVGARFETLAAAATRRAPAARRERARRSRRARPPQAVATRRRSRRWQRRRSLRRRCAGGVQSAPRPVPPQSQPAGRNCAATARRGGFIGPRLRSAGPGGAGLWAARSRAVCRRSRARHARSSQGDDEAADEQEEEEPPKARAQRWGRRGFARARKRVETTAARARLTVPPLPAFPRGGRQEEARRRLRGACALGGCVLPLTKKRPFGLLTRPSRSLRRRRTTRTMMTTRTSTEKMTSAWLALRRRARGGGRLRRTARLCRARLSVTTRALRGAYHHAGGCSHPSLGVRRRPAPQQRGLANARVRLFTRATRWV